MVQVKEGIKKSANKNSTTIANNDTFRLIISCKLDGINEVNLELDTCSEKSVRASSTIASQPLQGGYVMSDHMYRNPDEYSVKGSFSLNGNISNLKGNDYLFTNISSSTDRLTRIQEVFEYIKNYGILCDLTTISMNDINGVRFKTRSNMALINISWTERLNTMEYSFSFKEVINVEVDRYEGIPYKDNNPNTEDNRIMTLGELLKTYRDIPAMIIENLILDGYIDIKDLRIMSAMGLDALPDTLKRVVEVFRKMDLYDHSNVTQISREKEYSYTYGTISVDKNGQLINKSNTIDFAIYSTCKASAVILGSAFKALFGKSETNISTFVKQFKFIENRDIFFHMETLYIAGISNAIISYPEVNRLEELLSTMNDKISQIFGDTIFYTISNSIDDNTNRTLQLNLDNTYYYLQFNLDNTQETWHLDILDENKEPLTSGKYGTAVNTSGWCVISDLFKAKRYNNSLFITKDGNYEVYLYNPNYDEYINGDNESIEEVSKYLYGYYIIVNKGNIASKIYNLSKQIDQILGELGYN